MQFFGRWTATDLKNWGWYFPPTTHHNSAEKQLRVFSVFSNQMAPELEVERRKREAAQEWKEKECKTKPSCSQALPCCCCSPPRGAAVSPLPEFEAFPSDLTSSGSTSSSPSSPWRPAGAPCCGGSGWLLTGFNLNILSLTNHIITGVPQPFDKPQIHGIRRFAHFF